MKHHAKLITYFRKNYYFYYNQKGNAIDGNFYSYTDYNWLLMNKGDELSRTNNVCENFHRKFN